jgi:hypothetical protein
VFASTPDHIDFLKIDIQGAELKALQGMEELLHGNRVARILLEFWPYGLVRCGSEPGEVLKLLRRHGYVLYEIAGAGKVEPVSDDELLRRFPESEESWLNIYATKTPPQEPMLRC